MNEISSVDSIIFADWCTWLYILNLLETMKLKFFDTLIGQQKEINRLHSIHSWYSRISILIPITSYSTNRWLDVFNYSYFIRVTEISKTNKYNKWFISHFLISEFSEELITQTVGLEFEEAIKDIQEKNAEDEISFRVDYLGEYKCSYKKFHWWKIKLDFMKIMLNFNGSKWRKRILITFRRE